MVHGTSIHRPTALPAVAPRINSVKARTTPVFSAISKQAPTSVASLTKSPVATAPTSLVTTPQSQVPSAADDFRQLFGGLPGPAAPSPVTTPAVATPVNPPFVPSFRTASVTDGVNVWGLNSDYFATKDTAQWIANKYGTGQVIETPFEGSGGPFSASANEYQIKMADGRTVNAGILAGYYERNPESQFPGLADKLIRGQLGLA
jgi:hypothetical protein